MNPSMLPQLRVPDLLTPCPLPRASNPHYKEAVAESRAWINSYDILNGKLSEICHGNIELLGSYCYPFAGYEQFRTTCDFINLLFILDEISDDQTGADAHKTGSIYVRAMKHADWNDGSKLANITKDFRDRFTRLAGPRNTKRMIELSEAYANSVGVEAELREQGKVVDLETYIPLRRNNSAVPLCLALEEYILGIDLADEVYQDEIFQKAYWAVCDHVWWSNDIYSFDREQSRGLKGNNVVTVLMKENGTPLQETVDYVGAQCIKFMEEYLSARQRLPESLGSDAAKFIDAIGFWITGNMVWSFDSTRYFGTQRLYTKETGHLYLRPAMEKAVNISEE